MFLKSTILVLICWLLASCLTAESSAVTMPIQASKDQNVQRPVGGTKIANPTAPKTTPKIPVTRQAIAKTSEDLDCKHVLDRCPVAGGIKWQCKKRFVLGVNYAWYHFAGDFGGIPAYAQHGVAQTAPAIDKELADMKANGSNVIRWWVFADLRGGGITFSPDNTPSGLGPTVKADLLKALELAEKNDVYLMLVMFSFDAFKPTRMDSGANIRSIAPIITDKVKRKALIEKVIKPLVKIGESSPYKKRLMTWELINEPEWAIAGASLHGDPAFECQNSVYDCVTHKQMETWLSDLTKVVRKESKALISVGGAAIKWKMAWSKLDLDFHQFHMYDWVDNYFPYTNSPKQWGLTDKPILMGEYPLAGIPRANAAKLMNSWYDNGYAGAMGWAVSDGTPNWSAIKPQIKAFAKKRSCETQF